MAKPRSRVFKDEDGYWCSHVYFVDKWAGIQQVLFRSRFWHRAISHAILNS